MRYQYLIEAREAEGAITFSLYRIEEGGGAICLGTYPAEYFIPLMDKITRGASAVCYEMIARDAAPNLTPNPRDN